MKSNMRRELPGYDPGNKVSGEYDPEKLNKVCTVHATTKTCLDACAASEAKTMMGKALGLGQYMCVDSNFKENAPCLNRVHKTTQGQCESGDCGQYKQKMEAYKASRPTDLEGLKDMMKQSCLYMKCSLDCAKPKVVEACGQSAHNDVAGLVVKSVDFLKYTVETMGLGSAYPRECDAVTA